jgi:YHS domain-containing protein
MPQTTTLRLLSLLLALAIICIAGCGSASKHGPYNTTSDGNDKRLMLNGFDPVAYHTESKHILGSNTIKLDHDGVTYRFTSAENKAKFEREPTKYIPVYGGFCANGIPWGGDGDAWKLIDGRLHIFGGQTSKNYFLMDEAANLTLAAQYWRDEVGGSTALIQRYKRLILRVPHYKSGTELAQQYEQWQKQNPAKPASAPPQ